MKSDPVLQDELKRMEELRELILRKELQIAAWISKEEREAALHNLEADIKNLRETGKW